MKLTDAITDYHAHVYYDAASRAAAARLRRRLGARFDVAFGRWRDEPVGPHPMSQYQVTFAAGHFAEIVPWLMLNHEALTILIHPNTDDVVADHFDHPLWLGARLELDRDGLGVGREESG